MSSSSRRGRPAARGAAWPAARGSTPLAARAGAWLAARGRSPLAAAQRTGTVVAGAVVLMIAATTARSAMWQFNPRVELGGTYDDNYLLAELPSQESAVAGPFIDAQLELQAQTALSILTIDPEVHATLYPGHAEDQSTDGYLNVLDQLQTQRSQTRLAGTYSDQTIAAADLLPAAFPGVSLGQPVIAESGYVEQLERQQTVHLFPSTSYQWSERDHLDLSADYYRAWFSSSVPDQVGFQSFSGTAGMEYDASQRSTLSVRGQYVDFEPQGGLQSARHGGLDGEWDFKQTSIVSFYIRAGAGVTDGPVSPTRNIAVSDFEGGIGAHWTLQVTDIVVDILRTAVPSSFGILVNEDEARFRVTRRFTQRLAGFIAVRGLYVDEAVTSITSVPARSYATGSAGIEWRLTHDFSLDASYTYSWQKYTLDPLRSFADSNAVGLSIVYEPHRGERPELSTVGSGSPY